MWILQFPEAGGTSGDSIDSSKLPYQSTGLNIVRQSFVHLVLLKYTYILILKCFQIWGQTNGKKLNTYDFFPCVCNNYCKATRSSCLHSLQGPEKIMEIYYSNCIYLIFLDNLNRNIWWTLSQSIINIIVHFSAL